MRPLIHLGHSVVTEAPRFPHPIPFRRMFKNGGRRSLPTAPKIARLPVDMFRSRAFHFALRRKISSGRKKAKPVAIVKGTKLLIGTRIGSHCAGSRCMPGGHLEYADTFEKGARDEVDQETGLVISFRKFDPVRLDWYVANNVLEGKHYVGIFFVADWVAGEPQLKEPEKNEGWKWLDYDEVLALSKPGDAFLPKELFANYRDRILKL